MRIHFGQLITPPSFTSEEVDSFSVKHVVALGRQSFRREGDYSPRKFLYTLHGQQTRGGNFFTLVQERDAQPLQVDILEKHGRVIATIYDGSEAIGPLYQPHGSGEQVIEFDIAAPPETLRPGLREIVQDVLELRQKTKEHIQNENGRP